MSSTPQFPRATIPFDRVPTALRYAADELAAGRSVTLRPIDYQGYVVAACLPESTAPIPTPAPAITPAHASGWSPPIDPAFVETVPMHLDGSLPTENFQEERLNPKTYAITHHYDIGDQRVYVEATGADSADPKRAISYLVWMCDEWYGHRLMLSNLGAAAMLVVFYGYQHAASCACEIVDMYSDTEGRGPAIYQEILQDVTLHRPGLKAAMQPYLIDC